MAVALRGSAEWNSAGGNASTIPVPIPAETQPGDLLVALIAQGTGTGVVVTPPAGWTDLGVTETHFSVVVTHTYVRTAQAGDAGGTASFTSDTSRQAIALCRAYSGADATGVAAVVDHAQNTAPTAPATTATEDGSTVLWLAGVGAKAGDAAPTITLPSGYGNGQNVSPGSGQASPIAAAAADRSSDAGAVSAAAGSLALAANWVGTHVVVPPGEPPAGPVRLWLSDAEVPVNVSVVQAGAEVGVAATVHRSAAAVGLPLWGAAVGGNADPAPLETPAGRPLGVRRHYWNVGSTAASLSMCGADVAAGRVPWPSYKLDVSWEQAANGDRDAWFTQLCTDLQALGGPVLLTVHHEPEGDGDISAYVAMQGRYAPIAANYSRIRFGPVQTGWTAVNNAAYHPDVLWPGEFDAGSFYGFDAYNYYLTDNDGAWTEMKHYYDTLSAWAQSKGVDWAVGEFAISDGAADEDVGWITRAYDDAVARGDCLALAYFDSELNSVGTWTVEDHPGKLTTYTAVLQRSIAPDLTEWPT